MKRQHPRGRCPATGVFFLLRRFGRGVDLADCRGLQRELFESFWNGVGKFVGGDN
mgnify:CR=1 FL=1